MEDAAAPDSAERRPGRQHIGRLLVVAGGLALAVNLVVFAAASQDTTPDAGTVPTDIELLIPLPDAVMRPQDDVGVDLRDDLTGVLALDGGPEIPEDQYLRVVELGRVVFRPGPDKELRALDPGPHRATVTYWLRTDDRFAAGTPVFSYSWEFSVG